MQVEIWSDVLCPFCYIGKRRFEKALANSVNKNQIELVWKSFQLSPDMITDPTTSVYDYLAQHKGISVEQARQMIAQVTQMAALEGLEYDFDKAINANSFDAHRFSQLARVHLVQDEAEEKLFAAYFTQGKNIADHQTLIELGSGIGLDEKVVSDMLLGDAYANEVMQDIYEAQQVGVRGVPFFVFDRKYAVSGAQDAQVFEEVLEKAFGEWKQSLSNMPEIQEGDVCTPDGDYA